jgi:hypothetical protein
VLQIAVSSIPHGRLASITDMHLMEESQTGVEHVSFFD